MFRRLILSSTVGFAGLAGFHADASPFRARGSYDGHGVVATYPAKGLIVVAIEQDSMPEDVKKHIFTVRGAAEDIVQIAADEGRLHVEYGAGTLRVESNGELVLLATARDSIPSETTTWTMEGRVLRTTTRSLTDAEAVRLMASGVVLLNATEFVHTTVDSLLEAYGIADEGWMKEIERINILFASDIYSLPEVAAPVAQPLDNTESEGESGENDNGTGKMAIPKPSPPKKPCQAGGANAGGCGITCGVGESCEVSDCRNNTCACCNCEIVNNVLTAVCKCKPCDEV
ncbi:MAG: hypothetical protein ACE5HE_09495 [Phycisphaerae bacterium]